MQQLQVGGAGFLKIRPEPPQVVKLVAAAGIGEGQCVKIVARKKRFERCGIHCAVQLVKAVVRQRVGGLHQRRFRRQFVVFFRFQHSRGDGVQVKEEVLFDADAVERGQPHDERVGEIFPHPLL